MKKSGFHLNIAGWVPALLSVLIVQASCGRKIYSPETHSVSISQSHVKREFVYYPKPKPVELIKLDSRQPSKAKDSFQRIPPRRETIHWLHADSLNSEHYKDIWVIKKIDKASALLRKADQLDKNREERISRVLGNVAKWPAIGWLLTNIPMLLIDFNMGVQLYEFFSWAYGILFFSTILVLLVRKFSKNYLSGRYYRKRAVRMIRKAPGLSFSNETYVYNKLESLYVLRYYIPAYRLKRQLSKLKKKIRPGGIEVDTDKLREMENVVKFRTETERKRFVWRTVKVATLVLAVLAIIISLLSSEIGVSFDVGM